MVDSIAVAELRRLAKLLAASVEEFRDDPLTAAGRYARGAARPAVDAAKTAGLFHPPLRLAAGLADEFLESTKGERIQEQPDVTYLQNDPAAEQLGYEMGIPTPSSGGKPIVRNLVTKVFDKNKIAAAEALQRAGATRAEIWRRVGVDSHDGSWYQDIGGPPPKLKQTWRDPSHTQDTLGNFVDWPEAFAALRRYGIPNPENIPVTRLPGESGGHILPGRYTKSQTPAIRGIGLGDGGNDDRYLRTLAHEIQHGIDFAQTGIPAGANADKVIADRLAQLGNPHGLTTAVDLDQYMNAAEKRGLTDSEIKLEQDIWSQYFNNRGEQRARVSGEYSRTPESTRQTTAPFQTVTVPSGGKVHRFDTAVVRDYASFGRDMVDALGEADPPLFAIGAGIDSKSPLDQYYTRPEAVERVIAGLPAAPRLRRLRKADDIDRLLDEFLNSP